MERTYFRRLSAPVPEPVLVLTAYDEAVAAICRMAAQFDELTWSAPTPIPDWRASEIAGHLRCVADDLHEYLDEAPMSRYARLMATGAHADTLGRKLARQNAAELAALPDAAAAEHIAAFADSARRYAARVSAVWDLPHHQYRDSVVTVGGMAGAACAEWHLHAWDLARAIGSDYRPADPAAVLAGWRAGNPHLLTASPGARALWHHDAWHAVLAASGRITSWPGPARRVPQGNRWSAMLRRQRRN